MFARKGEVDSVIGLTPKFSLFHDSTNSSFDGCKI